MLTEEQKKRRLSGLGASDSPIVMGFSSFKTPYELYLEKTGLVSIEDKEESEQQYWGNKLEATIREHFAEFNGVTVETPDTIYHKEHDFIFANLDGFIPELNAVLEIKCANSFMRAQWDAALDDGIPMQYLVQIAKQVALANAGCGYCAVLIGGSEYRQYKYERDLDLERMIIDSDRRFWDCVTNKVEPDPICISDLALMYPKSTMTSLPVTESIYMDIEFIKMERETIRIHEDKMEKLKMNVMSYMKEAECIVEADNRPLATWKQNKRGTRAFLIK